VSVARVEAATEQVEIDPLVAFGEPAAVDGHQHGRGLLAD
jgi:hypothetical protein